MPEVKRIDSNNSKIKHTDELRAHLLDKEGNKIPHSVFGTDTTRTEIISQADGTGEIMNVGFTDRSGRPQAFGNDVTDYVQALDVTNGAIVIHTQRLKSDPGGNLLS